MKNLKLIPILAIFAFFFSCKTTKQTTTVQKEHATTSQTEAKKEHKVHWTYTGETSPKYWSNISSEYKDCDGSAQSPIDINDAKVVYLKKPNSLNIQYHTTKTNIVNNGHTIQFNSTAGNQVSFNNKTYQLKQFHLHSLSEHTINGKHLPLEVHFVNKANDGTYAVVAVFFKEGKESPFFKKFLEKLPTEEGKYTEESTFNIQEVLPETKQFYHYNGSFTTPPCTEIVTWILLNDTKTASKEQLEKLNHLLHNNYRPVQEINYRNVDKQ